MAQSMCHVYPNFADRSYKKAVTIADRSIERACAMPRSSGTLSTAPVSTTARARRRREPWQQLPPSGRRRGHRQPSSRRNRSSHTRRHSTWWLGNGSHHLSSRRRNENRLLIHRRKNALRIHLLIEQFLRYNQVFAKQERKGWTYAF
jgi:hypothetical protein